MNTQTKMALAREALEAAAKTKILMLYQCAVCGNIDVQGHQPDCKLAAALQALSAADPAEPACMACREKRAQLLAEGWGPVHVEHMMQEEFGEHVHSAAEPQGAGVQESIGHFADQAFGPVTSNLRAAVRTNEEMAELLQCLAQDDKHPKAPEEMADVAICLYRQAHAFGVDLGKEVERKMAINRGRTWRRDGTGHGYHVKPAALPAPDAGERG